MALCGSFSRSVSSTDRLCIPEASLLSYRKCLGIGGFTDLIELPEPLKVLQRVSGVLNYFLDPEDVIPDNTPGIGLLDDAIYADIVLKALRSEVHSYEEFCQYRAAEEDRRRNKGLDTHVGREEWLADKRAVLHSKMRQGRSLARNNRGWRMKLF